MRVEGQKIEHGVFLSAVQRLERVGRKPVGQFLVFRAVTVPAAAVPDDHVHIVAGNISAADITVIIVFAIEWTDFIRRHRCSTIAVLYARTRERSSPLPSLIRADRSNDVYS